MTHWIPQATQDGSFTFFSTEFGETFHSRQGAKAEAFQKFALATDLPSKAHHPTLHLLDVCYGLGYNTAAALETIWSVNPQCHVEVYGLELDPSVPLGAITPELLDNCWSTSIQVVLQNLAKRHACQQNHLMAHLRFGDARHTMSGLVDIGFQADAIFFDPFSPRCCPQLWTVEFFQLVARCLNPNGKLSTYSRSAAVRSAMKLAGLCIGTIPLGDNALPHEWSQGTVAAWNPKGLIPLSVMEQEHLNTRAAVPYRDSELLDSMEVILARHQQEQQNTSLESTSSWRRRWNIDKKHYPKL
jgi:tRNA U34 5-methylaminomethyl-2-thiouridine-forming methyltransferase MnmC